MEFIKSYSENDTLLIHDLPQKWKYILMLVLIALTGFSSFFSLKIGIYLVALFVLPFAIVKRQKIGRPGIQAIVVIAFLFILQQLKFNGSIGLVFTQIIRYLTLLYCAILLRPNFKDTYIKLMYYISFISLILYAITFIPGYKELLISIGESFPELRSQEFLSSSSDKTASLYIYTVSYVSFRNCGPFWEPGMFEVFLILALGLNLLGSDEKLNSKKNLVFIISTITTFSTTGYVCLAFLIVSYVYFKNNKLGFKLIGIIILPVVLTRVFELDFMTDKILSDMDRSDSSYSRFGAMLYHLEKIELSPILGFGVNKWPITNMDMIMRFNVDVSPNGWTIIPAVWGIPFAMAYFVFLFLGLKDILKAERTQTVIFFISVLLSVFSQDVTNRSLFYVIFFIGVLHCMPYRLETSNVPFTHFRSA